MFTCWMDVDMEEIKVYYFYEQTLRFSSRGDSVMDKGMLSGMNLIKSSLN